MTIHTFYLCGIISLVETKYLLTFDGFENLIWCHHESTDYVVLWNHYCSVNIVLSPLCRSVMIEVMKYTDVFVWKRCRVKNKFKLSAAIPVAAHLCKNVLTYLLDNMTQERATSNEVPWYLLSNNNAIQCSQPGM